MEYKKHHEMMLSIIVPVYNSRPYLGQCIESIAAAGLESLELIMVDDGSTDGSTELVREYIKKYQFIQLFEQKNSGPSAARNKGLREARGEYIVFFDSDDYIDPKSFAVHAELLQSHKTDIWASDFRRVADNACILDEINQIRDSSAPITDMGYIREFLSEKDCVWNVWRYIFRSDFLKENKLFFSEGFNIAEDLEFVVKALTVCKTAAFYHKPYYFYRVNYGATLTRKYTAQRVEQLMTMLSSAAEICKGAQADLIKAKLAREYILNLSLYWEVPQTDRAAALAALEKSKGLMAASTGVYSLAAKAVRLMGIKNAALLLYMMKRCKRLLRALKVHLFSGEEK